MIRLNNKGQSLVMFVCLLPLVILIFAFVIDMGFIINERIKLDNINKIALNYAKDNNSILDLEIRLENLIKKNDKDIDNIKIDVSKGITIDLNKEVDSIFGKVIGFKKYEINSKYQLLNSTIEKWKE